MSATKAQAEKIGIAGDEWDKVLQLLGRSPNEQELFLVGRLLAEDCSQKSSASLTQHLAKDSQTFPLSRLGIAKLSSGQYALTRTVQGNIAVLREGASGTSATLCRAVNEFATLGANVCGVSVQLRLGDPESSRTNQLLTTIWSSIEEFSCLSGIPITSTDLYLHPRYDGNPLFTATAIGSCATLPDVPVIQRNASYVLLYIGEATGPDGYAPGELLFQNDARAKRKGALSFASPYASLKLLKLAQKYRFHRGVVLMTMLDRGGLIERACAIAQFANRGFKLELERVPLRVAGIDPAALLISETPGRMIAVVEKDSQRSFNDALSAEGFTTYLLGEVGHSDVIECTAEHQEVALIPYRLPTQAPTQKRYAVSEFAPMLRHKDDRSELKQDQESLSERLKQERTKDEWAAIRKTQSKQVKTNDHLQIPVPENLEDAWLDILAAPNGASRLNLLRRFDRLQQVRLLPRAPEAVQILRLHEQSENTALALAVVSNPLFVSKDPYLGTVHTVAEALRELATIAARPIGATYCLNFGDPDDYRELSDLTESVRALGDACKLWSIPLLTADQSLKNGTDSNPILPTTVFSLLGELDLTRRIPINSFVDTGDVIFTIGSVLNDLSASEYLTYYHKKENCFTPDIDFDLEIAVARAVHDLAEKKLVNACVSVNRGGLAMALTRLALQREKALGCELEIIDQRPDLRPDVFLFSESSARFVVTAKPEHAEAVQRYLATLGIPITGRGTVGGKKLILSGKFSVEIPLNTLDRIWSSGLKYVLEQ
ncbi:hypothetical protein JNK13_05095 [bacterium]|nr:hypothetical protein [bacterium]